MNSPQSQAESDEKLLIFGWITTILGLPANGDPTKYNELTDRLYDLKLYGVPPAADSGQTFFSETEVQNAYMFHFAVMSDMPNAIRVLTKELNRLAALKLAAAVQAAQVELLTKLLEQQHVYNAKSTDGELNETNTGVLAVPVEVITALLHQERRK